VDVVYRPRGEGSRVSLLGGAKRRNKALLYSKRIRARIGDGEAETRGLLAAKEGEVMHKVWVFLIGPYLWAKAIHDHSVAIRRCRQAWAMPNHEGWQQAYDATWEPFNRTFDHLMAAFVMLTVYMLVLLALGILIQNYATRQP
jgi:DNA segregation ATPase FtsK/SpoIIIE-like protein